MKNLFNQFYKIIISIFIIYAISTPGYSQKNINDAKPKKIPKTINELNVRIKTILKETKIPGVVVAIISADSIIWIGTFGFANLETKKPITEDTHFCVGSCTKSFTGLGLLKLLDEGNINLQTAVCKIAPEVKIDNPWSKTDPVRIVHLLEHTSGFEDSHPNWFYFKGSVISLYDALKSKAHLRKVRWKPGTRFSYSSPGFTLAGYVIEKVSHLHYEEFMKRTLMKPIGMMTSTIGSSEDCRRLLAVGYDRHNKPYPIWYDYDEPAGALNASIKEMAFFIRFMLNRGSVGDNQIIGKDLFDKIGKPSTTLAARAGLVSGYSFGIGTRYRDGTKWYGHGGAVPGFISEYAYNLDHGLGFVVMQNSFDLSFHDEIFSVVWDYMDYLVESSELPQPVSLPSIQLQDYCGYYEPRNPRMRISGFAEILSGGVYVFCENGKLYRKGFMDTPRPYIPVAENLFRRPNDLEATTVFAKTSDGKMVLATQGAYFERTAEWRPFVYRVLVFGALIVMMSSILYSLFWIPVFICKRLKRSDNTPEYIRMRVIPLLAVLSLVVGIGAIMISEPSILEIGQKTPANVVFFISTLFFAGFSVLGFIFAILSVRKPVKMISKIYAFLLSVSCLGMTVYLTFWGIIGLRLWAY